MGWTVKISESAEKQLKKLNNEAKRRILDYLDDRLEGCKNPRHFGEPLKGNKSGFWRYRVGDFRIICEIKDDMLVVLTLAIGPVEMFTAKPYKLPKSTHDGLQRYLKSPQN